MLNISSTQKLVAQHVLLDSVVEAFNSFTNCTDEQVNTGGMLYVSQESMGERKVTLFEGAPRNHDGSPSWEVIEVTKDRHDYDVEEINTFWVKEVEFRSATSGASIKWVAETHPNENYPDGVPGTLSWEQGTPNYFGAYFNVFISVCKDADEYTPTTTSSRQRKLEEMANS